jgi:hypothetical protein
VYCNGKRFNCCANAGGAMAEDGGCDFYCSGSRWETASHDSISNWLQEQITNLGDSTADNHHAGIKQIYQSCKCDSKVTTSLRDYPLGDEVPSLGG